MSQQLGHIDQEAFAAENAAAVKEIAARVQPTQGRYSATTWKQAQEVCRDAGLPRAFAPFLQKLLERLAEAEGRLHVLEHASRYTQPHMQGVQTR